MKKSIKKQPVKIGQNCISNKDCINNNCVKGKCQRKKTHKNKEKILSHSKSKTDSKASKSSKGSKDSVKKTFKSSSFFPVKKKKTKKKKILIIESSSPDDSFIYQPLKEKNEPIEILPLETNLKNNMDLTIMSDNKSKRLNENYIELMDKLVDIMNKQGEPFRARAYKKAQETIMSYPYDINDPDQLKGKPNIGPTIMDKLIEFKETGTLRILEREKNNPVNVIANVYGIGPKKAKELVDKGIASIDELKEQQHLLNDVQKLGLKHYDDIMKRIPRSEIDEYYKLFEEIFNKMAIPDSKFQIVGSYRRGLKNSGDIDVILTGKTNEVFKLFLEVLKGLNIIQEFLSRGSTKSLTICKLPDSLIYRRVDFLYSSEEEYPFAVLYFTGSKTFNTVMRGYALKKGYTMNEHGIYKMDGKKKGSKIDYKFYTEKDIFDFLGLKYKSPEERIDGRAVEGKIVITNNNNMIVKNKPKNRSIKKRNQINNKKGSVKLIIEEEIEPTSNFDVKMTIIDFKENGIKILEELNEDQLAEVIRQANIAYFNKKPLLSDNQYDIIKEYIGEKYPNNLINFEVGASIEKNKVKLPYEMWSMDKIKPDTNALYNWMNKFKGPYVLSAKLDGVSGMYSTEGAKPKLYTRGNGFVGQDISHLIPFLQLPKTKGIVLRGEFIIPKTIFNQLYKDKFANSRNMVAGIINQKSISPSIKDVNFVAYEVIKPIFKPSEQMKFLKTLSADTVINEEIDVLSNELLSEKLVEWRENYLFEIDGIIVTNDETYTRKSGNPEHSFAFKMVLSDQIAEAKVIDVIWTPSKDGYLKPRVQIEPIRLGGVKIEYATGFNAAFIEDNNIGVGTLIQIIRSGDVIPYIKKIVVPAEKPLMPSVPYKWNSTHVDIMLENLNTNEIVREKNITGFFRGIGVEGLSSGNVNRLITAGFNSVPKIISMSKEEYLSIDGFKNKLATKIFDGIKDKINSAPLVTIMSASNSFGRGFSEKKMELIISEYPNVLISNEDNNIKIAKISGIKGMALKTAQLFVEKIPEFVNFMKESNLMYKLNKVSEKPIYDESNPLFGKTIVLTGFRDELIQSKMKSSGAKLGSSVSNKTDIVVVKDEFSMETGKAYEAKKLNIPVITKKQFQEKYM